MSDSLTRPTRRTLVLSAAWSVPVVSIAAAVPAFAASTNASGASGSAALKWSGDDGFKHVSWDLSLRSGTRALSSVVIAFTYAPNGGGGSGTFTGLDIYTFLPAVDNGWVVTGIPANGSNTATATHNQTVILANTTSLIHTDFKGQDNSSGTVGATVTVTYVDGGSENLPALSVAWAQAAPGNQEPAPHNSH